MICYVVEFRGLIRGLYSTPEMAVKSLADKGYIVYDDDNNTISLTKDTADGMKFVITPDRYLPIFNDVSDMGGITAWEMDQ